MALAEPRGSPVTALELDSATASLLPRGERLVGRGLLTGLNFEASKKYVRSYHFVSVCGASQVAVLKEWPKLWTALLT